MSESQFGFVILHYLQIAVSNWLPFYWRGFKQTTRYTYVIEALDDLEQVWSEFSKKLRWEIRKAQKQLSVRTDMDDIERFLDINALSFERQGLDVPYSRDMVRRLDAACAKHQARRMFFAEDAHGQIPAVSYIVSGTRIPPTIPHTILWAARKAGSAPE